MSDSEELPRPVWGKGKTVNGYNKEIFLVSWRLFFFQKTDDINTGHIFISIYTYHQVTYYQTTFSQGVQWQEPDNSPKTKDHGIYR